jgi:hypothetical protein
MTDNHEDRGHKKEKRVYEKPAIEWTEKIEARATACQKADEICRQAGGPLLS